MQRNCISYWNALNAPIRRLIADGDRLQAVHFSHLLLFFLRFTFIIIQSLLQRVFVFCFFFVYVFLFFHFHFISSSLNPEERATDDDIRKKEKIFSNLHVLCELARE